MALAGDVSSLLTCDRQCSTRLSSSEAVRCSTGVSSCIMLIGSGNVKSTNTIPISWSCSRTKVRNTSFGPCYSRLRIGFNNALKPGTATVDHRYVPQWSNKNWRLWRLLTMEHLVNNNWRWGCTWSTTIPSCSAWWMLRKVMVRGQVRRRSAGTSRNLNS